MTKEYECPKCFSPVFVHKNSWQENLRDNLPSAVVGTIAIAAIRSHDPQEALRLQRYMLARNAVNYAMGKVVTCHTCGHHFLAI